MRARYIRKEAFSIAGITVCLVLLITGVNHAIQVADKYGSQFVPPLRPERVLVTNPNDNKNNDHSERSVVSQRLLGFDNVEKGGDSSGKDSTVPLDLSENMFSTKIQPKAEWLDTTQWPYPKHKAYHTADHCPKDIDYNRIIRERRARWKGTSYLKDNNYWQYSVNDKLGAYVFSKAMGVRVPEIVFCTSRGPQGLSNFAPPTDAGFVVKNLDGHSAQGVYVLESGFGGFERLKQKNMSLPDVQKDLRRYKATDIFVEELMQGEVEGRAPFDFKFHMFNGHVGAIEMITFRGSDRSCHLELDENWNRLDRFGCFESSGDNTTEPIEGGCFPIDFTNNTHGRRFNPLCHDHPPPKTLPKMKEIAKLLSRRLGFYFRIDFYQNALGEVVLGEFSPNPTKGQYHCSARLTDAGCIDSCYLGRLWNKSSVLSTEMAEGGPDTPTPEYFRGWYDLSMEQKCHVVMKVSAGNFSFGKDDLRQQSRGE